MPLYDAVWAAGDALGIADFGLYAVNSLRMEKAYPGMGRRTHQRGHPGRRRAGPASSTWTIDFIGRSAVVEARERGASIHLAYLEVDATDTDVAGGEPVIARRTGDRRHHVRWLRARDRKSLAFAYVESGFEAPGARLEIALLGDRRPATVLARPVYDPDNVRPRS